MKAYDSLQLPCGVLQNLELLAQAETLLLEMSPRVYAEPCAAVFKASVGQHLRHALEHYDAFLRAFSKKNGIVDYEHRARDFSLESDPRVALRRLAETSALLAQITDENAVLVILDHGGGENPSTTSVGRELQFLASHTVHHFAMIGIIARLTGLTLTPSFGIAPSTLRYLEKNRAA